MYKSATDQILLRGRVKIIAQIAVGEIWLTTLELTDNIDEEPVLPQHLNIYTESKPDLGIGEQMGLVIGKNLVETNANRENNDHVK